MSAPGSVPAAASVRLEKYAVGASEVEYEVGDCGFTLSTPYAQELLLSFSEGLCENAKEKSYVAVDGSGQSVEIGLKYHRKSSGVRMPLRALGADVKQVPEVKERQYAQLFYRIALCDRYRNCAYLEARCPLVAIKWASERLAILLDLYGKMLGHEAVTFPDGTKRIQEKLAERVPARFRDRAGNMETYDMNLEVDEVAEMNKKHAVGASEVEYQRCAFVLSTPYPQELILSLSEGVCENAKEKAYVAVDGSGQSVEIGLKYFARSSLVRVPLRALGSDVEQVSKVKERANGQLCYRIALCDRYRRCAYVEARCPHVAIKWASKRLAMLLDLYVKMLGHEAVTFPDGTKEVQAKLADRVPAHFIDRTGNIETYEMEEVAEIIKKFGTLGPLGGGGSLQSPWGSPRGAGEENASTTGVTATEDEDAAESWTVVEAPS